MKKTSMLSSSRVTSPRATRRATNLTMIRTLPPARCGQDPVVNPAFVMSKWPIAVTSTLPTFFFVPVRK